MEVFIWNLFVWFLFPLLFNILSSAVYAFFKFNLMFSRPDGWGNVPGPHVVWGRAIIYRDGKEDIKLPVWKRFGSGKRIEKERV